MIVKSLLTRLQPHTHPPLPAKKNQQFPEGVWKNRKPESGIGTGMGIGTGTGTRTGNSNGTETAM